MPSSDSISSAPRTSPVIKLERGCPYQDYGGCGCTGACHELIDVVPADAYWRAIGERDELRRQLANERQP